MSIPAYLVIAAGGVAALLGFVFAFRLGRATRDEPWATREGWDRRKPGLDLDRLDHPRRKSGEL